MPKETKPATRASRRLRSSQEPDASPLREYVPPKRKTRAAAAPKNDESSRKPAILYTPSTEVVAPAVQVEDTKEATKVFDTFVRPNLFPQVSAVAAFEIEANKHASSDYLDRKSMREELVNLIMNMTDDQKVDLIIAQRAKIASQDEQLKLQKDTADSTANRLTKKDQEIDTLKKQLHEAEEKAQKQHESSPEASADVAQPAAEATTTTTTTQSKKRPAPVEDASEDDTEEEQRPARRVKLTHTPQATRQTSNASLSSNYQAPSVSSPSSPSPPPAKQVESRDTTPKSVTSTRTTERKQRLSTIMESSSEEEEAHAGSSQDEDRATDMPASSDAEHESEQVTEEQQSIEEEMTQEQPRQPETPSRWTSWIPGPLARIFTAGSTPAPAPRTAPVRRITNNTSEVRPQATPSQHKNTRRVSAGATRQDASPTQNNNKTSQSAEPAAAQEPIEPQTAPVRRAVDRYNGPPRRRFQERLRAIEEAAARRKATEEQDCLEAKECEEARLKEEAAALRKKSIEATQKTGEKRKVRIDDLEVIPNPAPGVFGLNDKYFGDDEIDEEEVIKDGVPLPSAKRVKLASDDTPARKLAWPTRSLGETPLFPKSPTPSLTADPHRAQGYTGTMFAEPSNKKAAKSQDPAAKAAKKARRAAKEARRVAKEKALRAKGTIGLVYSSSDDSSSSDDEEPRAPTYYMKNGICYPLPKAANDKADAVSSDSDDSLFNEKTSGNVVAPKTPERVNVFTGKSMGDNANTGKAPPSPTISHATLPAANINNDQNGGAALAKARSEAEKYKPKTPSGLRATSRLSSSPAFPSDASAAGTPVPVFTPAVALKDVMKPSGFANNEVPAETNQPGIFMTGAGPVNIFGAPIKSNAVAKPAPVAETPAATTPAASTATAAFAMPAAASSTTAAFPMPAATTSTATFTMPAAVTTPVTTNNLAQKTAAAPTAPTAAESSASEPAPRKRLTDEEFAKLNDGSTEFAIALANRVPDSEVPEYDIEWPACEPIMYNGKPVADDPVFQKAMEAVDAGRWDEVPDWAKDYPVYEKMYEDMFDAIIAETNARRKPNRFDNL